MSYVPPPCINDDYFALYGGVCIGVVVLFAIIIVALTTVESLRRDRDRLSRPLWFRVIANGRTRQLENSRDRGSQVNLPQTPQSVADCERRENTQTKDLVLANRRLCRQVGSAMNKCRTESVKNYGAPPNASDDEDHTPLLQRKALLQAQLINKLGKKISNLERSLAATEKRKDELMRAAQVRWFSLQVARARMAKVESNIRQRLHTPLGDHFGDNT